MNLVFYENLASTQTHLISMIKSQKITQETCIIAKTQTNGIGSRGNAWDCVERGLYCSFAKSRDNLPSDLNVQSMSIFFGFIFKENLAKIGSKVWLKYPNDLYIDCKKYGENIANSDKNSQKIGGIICNAIDNFIVCGIGVNLESSKFAHLESNAIKDISAFLEAYFKDLENYTWSEVFARYKGEFHRNYGFSFHHNGKIVPFKDAILLDDGAILLNDEVIYSTR